MWFRIILTAFALAVVLYLQFGFDIKDWIKHSSTAQMSESTPGAPEGEPVPSQP
jgi:hypothetical protein